MFISEQCKDGFSTEFLCAAFREMAGAGLRAGVLLPLNDYTEKTMRPEDTAMAAGDDSLGFTASEFAERQTSFRKGLETLLNQHSRENESNTPDFILADYLTGCLRAFDSAVRMRADWYGRMDKPGQ